ncbi:MAG: hypothetical protein IT318_01885 [Anaerolineales bacterium]|nr:hypothetical protein [Anaerolineales bacterium]
MKTPQDIDRLSAYIDNQLTPAERAALEARLTAEPQLREMLSDLGLTVRALRALPAVTPPRSFALTPAQAGASRQGAARSPWFPALRLATALSALMLAVVVAGDLGSGLLAMRPAATEEAARAVVTAPVEAPVVGPTASQTPGAEAAELMPATEEAVSAAGADTGPAEETPMASLMMPEGTPTPEASAQREAEPTAGPTEKQLAESTPTAVSAAVSVSEIPPNDSTETQLAGAGTPPGEEGAQPASGPTPLRTLELGLAMVTVLLGLGAWLARRNA